MNPMLNWAKTLTPEEARAFIRKIQPPLTRKIEGDEYDKVWTLLTLAGNPASTSNNQRTWTDIYVIGNQDEHDEYHVTWWTANELPEITVIIKEEQIV